MVATILTDFSYITPNNFIAVSVLFPLLDIIVVALRFYTRRVQKFSLKSDDWLTLAALVVNIGIGVTLIIEIKGNGISYLAAATPADSSSIESYLTFSSPEQTLNGKIQFAVLQLQILLLLLLKLSAIMFYRLITAVIVLAWGLAFFFTFLFQCRLHLWANWSTALDVLTYRDNTTIWRLKLSTKKKIAVTGAFLLGALSIATSVVQLVYFVANANAGEDLLNYNLNLVVTISLWWCLIESCVTLIAVCLPTLQFLFGRQSTGTVFGTLRKVLSLQSLRSGSGGWRSDSSDTETKQVLRQDGKAGFESHA